jgi:hypothetical protein
MRARKRSGGDIALSVAASLAAMLVSARFLRLFVSSYGGGGARAGTAALDAHALSAPVRPAVEERTPGRVHSFVLRWWPEATAALVTLAVCGYIIYIFTRFALPPGTDSGQWLTISRGYLQEPLPSGRDITVVPPVVPALLAGFTLVSGSAPGAIILMALAVYAALSAVAYLLGARLTGAATGGLLAMVFIGPVQLDAFESLPMGAYPQLVAVIGMAVTLLALIELVRAPSSRHWAAALGAGVALTLFSHTPSATVIVAPLALCLGYLLLSATERRVFVVNVALALAPVFALWLAFMFANRDVILGYAAVPAAYDLKGPDALLSAASRGHAQRTLLIGGLVMLFALPFVARDGRGWRARPSVVLTIWGVAIVSIVGLAALRQTNTDFPRFLVYFLVPLGLAAAAGVQALRPSSAVVVAIVAAALLFGGHEAVGRFDRSARFYGMNEHSADLRGVGNWLNQGADDGGVIGGTRETKWLEALTGRDTLLFLRRIYITRSWEIERAIDAEVVTRASAALESGAILATVSDGGEDYGSTFPNGLRVDVFHKGMYSEAFRLDDSAVLLTFERDGVPEQIVLSSLGPRTGAADGVLTTMLAGATGDPQVVRAVHMTEDAPSSVTVDLFIGARPGVVLQEVGIDRFAGAGPISREQGFARSSMTARLFDGAEVPVSVHTAWAESPGRPDGGDPSLVWQKLSITMSVPDGERRIDTLRTLDPSAMLHAYGIRYIVDRDGDGASFPIIRQRSLPKRYENGEYTVYELD